MEGVSGACPMEEQILNGTGILQLALWCNRIMYKDQMMDFISL
jgi:hypothetical protein